MEDNTDEFSFVKEILEQQKTLIEEQNKILKDGYDLSVKTHVEHHNLNKVTIWLVG